LKMIEHRNMKRKYRTMKSKVNKPRKSKHHRYTYKHSRCVRLISNETCDDNFIEDNNIIYSDTTPTVVTRRTPPVFKIDETSVEDCEICPNAPHNTTSYIIEYHRSELKYSNIFHNYLSTSIFHEKDYHQRYEVSWLPT